MQERFLAARRIEVIWICLGSCAKFLHRLIISMESNVSRVKLHPLKELLEASLEEQRSLPRTSRRPSRSVTKLGSEPWWNQTWFPLRHPVMRSSPDVKVRIPAATGRSCAGAPCGPCSSQSGASAVDLGFSRDSEVSAGLEWSMF